MNVRHITLMLFLLSVGLWGCAPQPSSTPAPTTATPAEEGHHHHEAPHGGTLVVLGDEFAHLELVLEPSNGELTLYVLDGEAKSAVQLEGGGIVIEVEAAADKKEEITFSPVANELTGETAERTSQFSGRSEILKGVTDFTGEIQRVTVKGQEFTDVEFRFPEGNETPEDHHEGDHHEGDHHEGDDH